MPRQPARQASLKPSFSPIAPRATTRTRMPCRSAEPTPAMASPKSAASDVSVIEEISIGAMSSSLPANGMRVNMSRPTTTGRRLAKSVVTPMTMTALPSVVLGEVRNRRNVAASASPNASGRRGKRPGGGAGIHCPPGCCPYPGS
ncbi:hypothetical protein ACFPRL_11055 [Pseudoclavibacter helvolus]